MFSSISMSREILEFVERAFRFNFLQSQQFSVAILLLNIQ